LNVVQAKSVRYWMDKYTVGNKIVDVGAGLGGPCRVLQCEYGREVHGLEYVQRNVDVGNQISRDLGLTEILRYGDATQPFDVADCDGAVMFGVLSAIPKGDSKTLALKHTFEALVPGGIFFFEDICFQCLPNEFPEPKAEDVAIHSHLHFCESKETVKEQLLGAGFIILEEYDVSHLWSEAAWAHANDNILPLLEGDRELDDTEKFYFNFLGLSKPRFYSDVRHMTVEGLKHRYPRLTAKVDPAYWVNELTHNDVKQVRYICLKPKAS